jgi:hypothetical protein
MPVDLEFWISFMLDRRLESGAEDLTLRLLKAGFDNAPDEDFRSGLVDVGFWLLDIDNPSLRQKLLDLMKPYRDPVKYPQTMENIRMYDAVVALRTGKAINLDTDLGGFRSAPNISRANHLRIRALLQERDMTKLKSILNGLSADQMMSRQLICEVLPALDATNMTDEASLAREALAKKLYQDALTVWFGGKGVYLHSVCEDIETQNSSRELPVEFGSFVDSHIARQLDVLSFRFLKAYVDKDWKTASAAAEANTKLYPNEYTTYWFLGKSLAELGKKEEAVKALTVYCKYSHDELWYPEAKDLLGKLTGAAK